MKSSPHKKQVKHKHKWEQDFNDCPFCGEGGYYYSCECGEIVKDIVENLKSMNNSKVFTPLPLKKKK